MGMTKSTGTRLIDLVTFYQYLLNDKVYGSGDFSTALFTVYV